MSYQNEMMKLNKRADETREDLSTASVLFDYFATQFSAERRYRDIDWFMPSATTSFSLAYMPDGGARA